MDIALGFKYIFNDEHVIKKIIIGSILFSLSIFIIPFILVSGYFIRIVREVQSGNDEKLPSWNNLWDLFKSGLKYDVALFLIMIPILFLLIILVSIFVLPIIISYQTESDIVFCLFYPCMIFIQIIVPVFCFMYFFSVMPSMTLLFNNTGKIGKSLNLKSIFAITRNNYIEILIIAGLQLLLVYLVQIGLIFLLFGIFVTGFYAILVYAHLLGQLSKKVFS